jgi:16S rRNA (cytosine967-C5)-methyltransferase
MEHERLSERAAFARASKQLGVTDPNRLRTAQMLVLETTRRRSFIDHLTRKAAGRQFDLDLLQHGLVSFLRMFCYWTKFHGASDHDIVRMVRAARSALGWRDLHRIELMLGRILALDLQEATLGLPPDETLALSLCHPAWFLSACEFLLGRRGALRLMQRNLEEASSYIRINTLRGSEETCLRELDKAGIEVRPVENLPFAFKVLNSRRAIVRTEPYRQGRIAIQDKASILASAVASPEQGDLVVDVCAAPGAKTTHLAQLMQNKGTIYAIDRSLSRMSFWRREISRLGVKIAQPLLGDATEPLPVKLEADVVMLDPPCSNTGTFWKSPATKWMVDPVRVGQLAHIQLAMLENASRLVREGGTLVYSTCSILAEENEHVVNRFIRANPDFRQVDSEPRIGLPGLYGSDKSQRLYPHTHDCNGHFLSRIVRVG